jgi:thiol-disulfide isomerase/thioredoxin/protocatechuate 3,4-dioxygenase beta subunit
VYRYPVKTDKDGRWVCKVTPAQLNAVWLRFVHPDYISDDTFGQTANNISIDQLRAGSLVSVMKKGITVEGKVVDKEGQPISGAVVYQGKDRFGSSYPDTKTDGEGIFKFPNSRFDEMVLTIVAKGFAPETKIVDVTPEMEAVEILLKPGNRLRIRTVDAADRPLGNVMIVPDTWRELRSLADAKIPRRSNKNGIYVWNDAPSDVVQFDILARGYMDRRREKLMAQEDEYVIKMIEPLSVHGTVIDAVTSTPIEQFKVVQGIKWDQRDNITWELQDAVTGRNGQYEIKTTYPRPGHVFRFDAVGYKSVVSPIFQSDQGNVLHDVSMQPAVALIGEVRLPSGEPVVGAQVILNTAGHYVAITNGRFSDARDAVFATTDGAGKFELPTPEKEFRLIAVHDDGMIEMASDEFEGNQKLVLKPWASIRGEVKIGVNAAKQTQVQLSHLSQIPYQQPNFRFTGQTITDDDGRYELLRVPPGEKFQLSRVIVDQETNGRFYTHSVHVETQPGSEHVLNLGGRGRPIIGRVNLPKDLTDYRIGVSRLSPKLPEPPMPDDIADGPLEQRQQWFTQWSKTEAGIEHMARATQNMMVVVKQDATFRIEDVPAGTYSLNISVVSTKATEDIGQGEQLGSVSLEVDLPEMTGGRSDAPLDIGSLQMKPRVFLRVGDMAPELKIKTLDGRPLTLADYQGKYVLLDFWATWCGPCLAELPNLKKTQEEFADDERFVIVSVSIDSRSADAAKYVKENPLPWPQGHVDEDNQQKVLGDFDFQGIPATFLIDPQGKIIAKDLRGENVGEKIAELIRQ